MCVREEWTYLLYTAAFIIKRSVKIEGNPTPDTLSMLFNIITARETTIVEIILYIPVDILLLF
jgi:hypothetical protein